MGIGAQLVDFFDTATNPLVLGHPDFRAIHTLDEFVHAYPQAVSATSTLLPMCRRLCEAGYLANIGISSYGPAPLLGRYMATPGFDEQLAGYGVYDFIALGFTAVR